MSLINQIKLKFQGVYPSWINSGEIEKYGIELGYKASHADRRMRDLFTNGVLEKRKNGVSVDYRYRVEPAVEIQKCIVSPSLFS